MNTGTFLAAACAAALGFAPSTLAQTAAPSSQEDAERKKLEEQLRLEMGKSTEPRAPEARIAAQGAAGAGQNPLARLQLLPDISAIGSTVATWDDQTEKLGFAFEELELGLQAVVDPYLRADIFIAFTPEEVAVEEAYVTTLGLPAGLQLRAGRIFAPFGKLNQTHPHVWEFVEAPLAQGLVAEESLGGGGLEVGWLLPAPWFAELKVGGFSTAPSETDEPRLTGVARLSQYWMLTDAATLGVGLSAARRDEGVGQFRDLANVDVYLKVRPPASRSYLTVSGEYVMRRWKGVDGVDDGFEKGFWAQAFGRIGPHFGVGARYEQAPFEAEEGSDLSGDTKKVTGVLAWLPSEFQRVRLEVSKEDRPDDAGALAAMLHLEFGIGAHGAHPF